MHKKVLLLFTIIYLFQHIFYIIPLWAMRNDEDEGEPAFRFQLIGNIQGDADNNNFHGRFRITPSQGGNPIEQNLLIQAVQHVKFQPFLPSSLDPHIVDPLAPLSQELGYAKERVKCTLRYQNADYFWEGIDHRQKYNQILHRGGWRFQENRDQHATLAKLTLKICLPNQAEHKTYKIRRSIPHTLISTDPEIPGRLYYDGQTAYHSRTALQHWREPATRTDYIRNAISRDGDIESHQGNRLIFIEAFGGFQQNILDQTQYVGEYDFDRTLADNEKNPRFKEDLLVYSDGTYLFLPKVTQELWRKDHQTRVRFSLVSYKDENRIQLNPQVRIEGHAAWPEGLYHRLHVYDDNDGCAEEWEKLDIQQNDNNNLYRIEIDKREPIFSVALTLNNNLSIHKLNDYITSQLLSNLIVDPPFFDDPTHEALLLKGLNKWKELQEFKFAGWNKASRQGFASDIFHVLPSKLKSLSWTRLNSGISGETEESIPRDSSILSAFTQNLGRFVNLEELEFDHDPSISEEISELTNGFQCLRSLRNLGLKSITLQPAHIINKFRQLRLLEKLILTSLESAGGQVLAGEFQYLPNLRYLDLTNAMNEDTDSQAVVQNLRHLPLLEYLYLGGSCIKDLGAQAIGQGMQFTPHLKVLNLERTKITHVGGQAIADGLCYVTQLQELKLGQNELGEGGGRAIAQNLRCVPSLILLDLIYNHIGDASAQDIGNNLQHITHLCHLGLSANTIGINGARVISQGLRHTPHLLYLSIGINQDMGAQGVEEIIQGLRYVPELKELSFRNRRSNNNIGTATDSLASNLRYVSNLRVLDLYQNSLEDAGIQTLSLRFRDIPHLRMLHLGFNKIQVSGAIALANSFQAIPELRYLYLDGNKIQDSGAQVIGANLRYLTKFKGISAWSNDLTSAGEAAIQNGLPQGARYNSQVFF